VEVYQARIFSLHFVEVSLDCTIATEYSTYIHRYGSVAANGFAIREHMDGAVGRKEGEELFRNLNTHDL
jgi:hypothetical protein